MRNVVFFLGIVFLSYVYSEQPEVLSGCSSMSERLEKMDPKDRAILENFFRSLFKQGDFAYTLFGDKPMAAIHHFIEFVDWWWNPELQKHLLADWRGWEVWKRYQSEFPLKNFFFGFTSLDPSYHLGLVLLNKEECQKIIRSHNDFFKNFLEMSLTEEEMIEKICVQNLETENMRPENWSVFLGLLLGYEEKNVRLFEEQFPLYYKLKAVPFDLKNLNEKGKKKLNLAFFSPCDERCSFQSGTELIKQANKYENMQNFFFTKRNHSLSPLSVPYFIIFEESPALTELCLRYDQFRKKLVDIYYSPNFLEIILTRLSS